jgi:hypothetical protein
MKNLVRFRKSDFDGNIRVSSSWITNGHWALRKTRVQNEAIAVSVDTVKAFNSKADVATVEDSFVERVTTPPKNLMLLRFNRTRINLSRSDSKHISDISLFLSDDKKNVAWLDREYVELFGLETLWGHPNAETQAVESAVFVEREDSDLTIMPIRAPEKSELREELGQLL